MIRFLFKYLLAANYSFIRKWSKKKTTEHIIYYTARIFSTPFSFITAGLYLALIGSIEYKFQTYTPILIGLGIVMLSVSFFIEKEARKAISKWGIEKEYKSLNKAQRQNRNTFAFLFFWSGFILFFYLGVTYFSGYSLI